MNNYRVVFHFISGNSFEADVPEDNLQNIKDFCNRRRWLKYFTMPYNFANSVINMNNVSSISWELITEDK